MAIIDRDGLFGGRRLLRCSDRARLLWPYLFLAANGFGRIELDWQQITYEVFRGFSKPIKESELVAVFEEYRTRHLIFTYKHGGQTWGQWFCKAGSLPRWKTTKDKNSPEPPAEAYDLWLKSYGADYEQLQNSAEGLENIPLGIGVGKASVGKANTPWRERTFDEFWAAVWLKTGKDAAWNAWERKIQSEEHAAKVISAAIAQGADLLAAAEERARRDNSKPRPLHPATWLNQGRYDDQPLFVPAAGRASEEPNLDFPD